MTDLEICNLALVRMGIHKQLASLADTSSEGKALAVLLPRMKERVLSAHAWSWALRHVVLTEATGTPDPLPFDWTYAYDLPSDFSRPVRLHGGARRAPIEDQIAFQVAPVRSPLAVGAVTHTAAPGGTAGIGSFTLTGTPTEGGDFTILISSASSEPFGGGEAVVYAVVLKDGAFKAALEMVGASPDFPYDATGVGLTGVTIAMAGASTTFVVGDTYSFSVSGTEATAAATQYLLTDTEDADLVYVTNDWLQTTPLVTPPAHVQDVTAWLLAAEMALPLAKRPDLSGYLAQTAQRELRRAIALDRGAAAPDPEPLPFNLRARG